MKARSPVHKFVIVAGGPSCLPAARLAYCAPMNNGWETLDDETLLARLQDGSHHAFAVLVKRHATRFYRVAYRFTGHKQEAEDAVQDAFVKLWERPDIWQPGKAKFTTWFHRVVVNRCLDLGRKKTPLPLDPDFPVADEREAQDDALMRRQEEHLLEAAIKELPERQRTALNLCFYEDLSNQEAAEIMGVHLKALQSLLMRAKTTLKERIKAYA